MSDPHDAAHDHHILPVSLYLKVYGALLVLTYLTVQVSVWALGSFSLPVAMAVAVVKAGLVVGFFMHLRYDTRFYSLIFFGTVIFLVIFAAFTLFDLVARGALVEEEGTFVYREMRRGEENVTALEAFYAESLEERLEREAEEVEDEP